ADAPEADAAGIDIAAPGDPVEDGGDGLLIFGPDADLVFGLALARPVDRQGREPTIEEDLLVGAHLLLRRIEPHQHDHERRVRMAARAAELAHQLPAFEGNRDAL